jgi:lipoprotein-anchoring transpeptidase ErfK/SrfK
LTNFVGVSPLISDHRGFGTLRTALISGFAFAMLAASVASSEAAPRRYFFNPGYGYFGFGPPPAPRRATYPHRAPASPAAATTLVKKPNPEKDGFADMPKGGVLQIAISIGSQRLTLFQDGVRVAQAPVSTGTPGHPTPTGVFSVIEKDRWHHSNLYGNAPMYFMQRVTWSGVAMHEGALPGVPASHGCIRLPHEFAARLWPTTKLGVRVVIARPDLAPVEFAHPALFVPKAKPAEPKVAMNATTDGFGERPMIVAQATDTITAPTAEPPTARPAAEDAEEAQAAGASVPGATTMPTDDTASTPASGEAVTATGAITPVPSAEEPVMVEPSELRKSVEIPSISAPTSTVEAAPPAADPSPIEAAPGSDLEKPAPVTEPSKPAAPRTKLSDQPVKRGGQVAVFVSRKEKKIFVRQGFIPLFDMPITIDNLDQPLGTHVFTAMAFTDDGAGMRWNLITVPNEPLRLTEARDTRRRSREPLPHQVETRAPSRAGEALERIHVPPEAIERISELLIPGSSLVISDEGLGRETGRMTEFIVLTR